MRDAEVYKLLNELGERIEGKMKFLLATNASLRKDLNEQVLRLETLLQLLMKPSTKISGAGVLLPGGKEPFITREEYEAKLQVIQEEYDKARVQVEEELRQGKPQVAEQTPANVSNSKGG